MIIQTLVCHIDGTQELVDKEVPDDWNTPSPPPSGAETEVSPDPQTDLLETALDHEARISALELTGGES